MEAKGQISGKPQPAGLFVPHSLAALREAMLGPGGEFPQSLRPGDLDWSPDCHHFRPLLNLHTETNTPFCLLLDHG